MVWATTDAVTEVSVHPMQQFLLQRIYCAKNVQKISKEQKLQNSAM
jgi:hypothetical protein